MQYIWGLKKAKKNDIFDLRRILFIFVLSLGFGLQNLIEHYLENHVNIVEKKLFLSLVGCSNSQNHDENLLQSWDGFKIQ